VKLSTDGALKLLLSRPALDTISHPFRRSLYLDLCVLMFFILGSTIWSCQSRFSSYWRIPRQIWRISMRLGDGSIQVLHSSPTLMMR
jgi:hypothetical protein